MFKKSMIALFAALVLTASFANANAQRNCVNLSEEGALSAYPAHAVCR